MFYENNLQPNLTIKGKWKPFLVIWESVLIQWDGFSKSEWNT